MVKRITGAIAALILIGILTACSGPKALLPSQRTVRQAIALQVTQTQQALAQQIQTYGRPKNISPTLPKVKIQHVEIRDQEPLQIDGRPAAHVRGTYEVTLQFPHQVVTQPESALDLYLQTDSEGKVWRLAVPQPSADGQPTWQTYGLSS